MKDKTVFYMAVIFEKWCLAPFFKRFNIHFFLSKNGARHHFLKTFYLSPHLILLTMNFTTLQIIMF